jgi:hypothetical protein
MKNCAAEFAGVEFGVVYTANSAQIGHPAIKNIQAFINFPGGEWGNRLLLLFSHWFALVDHHKLLP